MFHITLILYNVLSICFVCTNSHIQERKEESVSRFVVSNFCVGPYLRIDCSSLGSSVHRILQARILDWVAIPLSRGSSQPRDGTQVSCIRRILYQLGHKGSPRILEWVTYPFSFSLIYQGSP